MQIKSTGERTKIILADALRSLMKKKTFDKITIKEIVEECGFNRQTFYYHFQDVFALVEWMYYYDIGKISDDDLSDKKLFDTIKKLLTYIEEKREEMLCIIESDSGAFFSEFLGRGISRGFDFVADRKTHGMRISKDYRDFLSTYFTGAVLTALIDWIKKPDSSRPSAEEFTEMLMFTLTGALDLALKNYNSEA